jgi:hypothetical protein
MIITGHGALSLTLLDTLPSVLIFDMPDRPTFPITIRSTFSFAAKSITEFDMCPVRSFVLISKPVVFLISYFLESNTSLALSSISSYTSLRYRESVVFSPVLIERAGRSINW